MKLIVLIILIDAVSALAQSDTQAPNLVSLGFTPRAIDTGEGSQIITFTAHLTDDVSGIGSSTQARFRSPSGQQFVDVVFHGISDLASGKALTKLSISRVADINRIFKSLRNPCCTSRVKAKAKSPCKLRS